MTSGLVLQMMWSCWPHLPVTFSSCWFGSLSEAVGMGISTSKSEAMVPQLKKGGVPTLDREGNPALSGGVQVPWGLIHEWGKNGAGDLQADRCGICSDADSALVRRVEGSERWSSEFTGQSFFSTLTYDHEVWVVSARTRMRVKEAEMSFFHRVAFVKTTPTSLPDALLFLSYSLQPHLPYSPCWSTLSVLGS